MNLNIAFHYIYRDGANYKNFNTVIFNNDVGITIEELATLLKEKLIGEEYFYADNWKLPDLHFGSWDEEIDHDFHTFEGIEYTEEASTTDLTLVEFVNIITGTEWA